MKEILDRSLKCRWNCGPLAGIAIMLWTSAPVSAASRDMEHYFSGKTVTVIVGSTPGGGADFNARLFAQYAVHHFPGQPAFIVQNLPGGGQLRGLQAGMRAKPDGLTAASLLSRWAAASILGQDLGAYDVKTAKFVGSPIARERGGLICADRRTFATWKAVVDSGQPFKIGSDAPGDERNLGALLVQLLGGPVRMIYGYGGVAESTAAFDRGELNGVACPQDTVPRMFPEWIEKKRLAPLFYWGPPPADDYISKLEAEEKPVNVFDLPGMQFGEEQRTALQVAQDIYRFTRALVLPSAVPDDIYQTWKQAYEETTNDPELIAAGARGGVEIKLGRLEEFQQSIVQAEKLSPAGLQLFKSLMGIGKQ
jgi:tripartite-type tricarboxylate transporter receptor subunit TctC